MNEEWANRGGILAEALAFLLIAPEFLGAARLRSLEAGVEAGLEGLGRAVLRIPPVSRRSRAVWFLPNFNACQVSSAALAWVITSMYLLLALVLVLVWAATDAAFTPRALVGTTLLLLGPGLLSLVLMRSIGLHPTVNIAAHTAGILGAPILWATVLLASGIFSLLKRLASVGVAVLCGENRLRALVFGCGVLLLFGGMAAQFAATF
jgi:hypothetical protein